MKEILRKLFAGIILASLVPAANSQEVKSIIPEAGPFEVGYEIIATDSERVVPVHIWYPAGHMGMDRITLKEYSYLSESYYKESKGSLSIEEWAARMKSDQTKLNDLYPWETMASFEAPKSNSKFPLIVYASSFRSRPIENFVLFEYLASHGFVVAAVSSLGLDELGMMMTSKGVQLQYEDIQQAFNLVIERPDVDKKRVGIMGFSLGASSVALLGLRESAVLCMASLDGAVSYSYDLLGELVGVNGSDLSVPYLELLQRPVATQPLDSIFFKQQEIAFNKVYPGLDHYDFSALTLLLKSIRPDDYQQSKRSIQLLGRNDTPYEERYSTYKEICLLLLKFYTGYLKNDLVSQNEFKALLN